MNHHGDEFHRSRPCWKTLSEKPSVDKPQTEYWVEQPVGHP